MQLSAMVEGMDIIDREHTGIARAVHLAVNDREYTLEVDPRESLLDVLRERLDLTGTKKGCDQDACGACTVHVDGAIMGIGQALLEATTTDRTMARILNPGLNEYLIPAHADVPVIDVAFVEDRDDQINVLGVKGLGELPATGVAPAIANAVHHATGRRIRDLPIRPEMLI